MTSKYEKAEGGGSNDNEEIIETSDKEDEDNDYEESVQTWF